ncbi:MAG: 4Fe-4S binding protein [Lentisphaerae bacterium]|nr:4Fe-4S binding protein [Lentisphaerota bacterium]
MRTFKALWMGVGVWVTALTLRAADRFPRPDFKTDYVSPDLLLPGARGPLLEWLDVAVLAAALALAGWLAIRNRSRRGLVLLTLFSLGYFGFWRRGCVCAVGAVQNLALGWADASCAIPLTVIAFFVLPLLATLLVGRVFCASVCPLGAIQELALWRPIKTPIWLNHTLGLLPWGYLSVAVLFAATGAGFLICEWDPFVGFFRLGAPFHLAVTGALFLLASLFIGRPYCRFACPYGAILGLLSRVSRRHTTITPDACVQCRLCEDACPYGAIRSPLPAAAPESRATGVRRLALILAAVPLIAVAAAATGYFFGNLLSRAHPRVALALEIHRDAAQPMSLEREAFFTSGRATVALDAEARAIQRRFAVGGVFLGALLALTVGAQLIGLALWRSRTDYEPDRARCFSCGRCFAYCPVGRKRKESPK